MIWQHHAVCTGIGEVRTAYNSQVLLWIITWLSRLVDAKKAMPTRAFGLNLINVALETSANVIGKVPAVVSVIAPAVPMSWSAFGWPKRLLPSPDFIGITAVNVASAWEPEELWPKCLQLLEQIKPENVAHGHICLR